MITTAPLPPAISPAYRHNILTYAAHLVPEHERCDAGLVLAVAAPLLEWVAKAADEDDVRNRMRALERQDLNTPSAGQPVRDGSRRWTLAPPVTAGQFLAEAGKMYAFIAGGK